MNYQQWLSSRPRGFRSSVSSSAELPAALSESLRSGGDGLSADEVSRCVFSFLSEGKLPKKMSLSGLEKAYRALGGPVFRLVETPSGDSFRGDGKAVQQQLAIRLLDWVQGSPDIQKLADVWLSPSLSDVSVDLVDAVIDDLRSYDTQEASDLADEIQAETGRLSFGGGYTQESLRRVSHDILIEELARAHQTERRLRAQLRERDAMLARERARVRCNEVLNCVDEITSENTELLVVRSALLECRTVDEVRQKARSFLRVSAAKDSVGRQ